MKKVVNKKIILLLILILFIPINVFAQDKIILNVDKNDLTVGDEITVSAEIPKDFETYAFLATLKYDENVFEPIDDSDFFVRESESIMYNPYNNKFGIINKAGKVNNELFTVHLKVKENANVGDTNIALTNISSSDGAEKTDFASTSVKVLITRDAKEGEAIPNNKENEIKEDEDNTINTFSTMPFIMFFILLAAVLLFAIVYIKVKGKKEYKKPLYAFVILEVLLIASISVLAFHNYAKKDVNNDGVKDYQDAEEIIKYLIDIEGTKKNEDSNSNQTNNKTDSNLNNNSNTLVGNNSQTQNRPSDFDTNNDGKVDVNDAGHVTENTTKNTEVTIKEYKKDSNNYVQKGDIVLEFTGSVSVDGVKIAKVKIEDKYYDVILNNGVYSVKLDSFDKAGIYTFEITEVVLDNNKTIKSSLKITKEVLKLVPYINNFNLDDEKKSISFALADDEDAFISGNAVIYDKDEVIASAEITGKETTIPFDGKEDVTYKLEIIANYDLDSNKNDKANAYYDVSLFSESFTLGGEYNFTLTDVMITDALQPGEIPVVSFKSTNDREAVVSNANLSIDGDAKDYNISKIDGNNYEVELTNADLSAGKHTVTLNDVGLSSLKTFYNDEDYKARKLTYTVLKKAPSVEKLEAVNDAQEKKINVTFKLNDENNSIKKLKVVIIDSSGKIIDTSEIPNSNFKEEKISTSLSYKNSVDGFYKVTVVADYDLSDKYSYTNKTLKETEILTQYDIRIDAMYVTNSKNQNLGNDNLYPVKEQKDYQIAFELYVGDSINAYSREKYKTNYSQVSNVTINGLNYPASQFKHDTATSYMTKIYLIVPSESGILDIKANRVQLTVDGYYKMYSTDYYSVNEQKLTIDVLQDKPKIENLLITDNYDKSILTFDFDVTLDKNATADNFTDGKIKVGNIVKNIKAGHNTIVVNEVPKDEAFDVIFSGSYDLDTDKLNDKTGEKNEKVNDKLFQRKYGLYDSTIYDKIAIENGKLADGKYYFEKNEKINLNFDVANIDEKLETTVHKLIIDGKEYEVKRNGNTYSTVVDGYNKSGEKEIIITDIILHNGKKITLSKPYSFKFEVLKDLVKVNDYKYEDLNDKIKVTFSLKDSDKANIDTKVKITDENDTEIYNGEYQDTITFNKVKDSSRYYIKVISTYDQDIDKKAFSENYHKDVTLLDEMISYEENNIEFKNISDINLYKIDKTDGEEKIILQDTVIVSEIENNKEDYFIEIVMDNLPTARAKISGVVTDNNMLTLVLNYSYVTKENTNKTQRVRIDFGAIEDGKAINEFHPANALLVLLRKLEAGENVTLNRNYDASAIDIDGTTYVTNPYAGVLDGNGYTIKNLTKPLFKDIKGGEVKNLNIVDVILPDTGQGALANETHNATITNVVVDKVIKRQVENIGGNGGLIGTADKTEINNCAVKHLGFNLYWLAQQNGTFIGISNDCKINNSYAQGTINSGWNYTSGFIGNAKSTTVSNSYVKVTLSGQYSTPSGFANRYQGTGSTFTNNLAFVTGSINAFASGAATTTNNYICTTSEFTEDGVKKVASEEINSDLFKNNVKFSEELWNLKDISIDNLPTFIGEDKTKLENINNYDSSKEIAYKNMMKLAPFYDDDKIIEMGNKLNDSTLINNEIANIVPVNKNGKLVTYLTSDNPKEISKLKLIFKNNTKAEYDVMYEKTYDMVATYKISGLDIDYNYNHYVINSDAQVVNNLVNYLKNLDYTNNLDVLTTNDDSRIYRDFYNETTRFELKEFVLKYLSNSSYTNTSNNEYINDYIEREVKKDNKIEKALYVYNYFRRFYDLDVDGLKIYDFVMFDMQGFNDNLTMEKIVDLFFSDVSGAYFSTSATNNAYNNLLSSYTELYNVSSFLDYVVTHVSNYDMDTWAAKQFKGILREIPIEGHEKDIDYTLWDHLSTEDANYKGNSYKVHNFVLPILTLPDTAAYIISAPAQFTIGSQRTYMANPKDEDELAAFNTKMQAYVDRIQSYYNGAYDLLQDAKLFNDIHLFQIDKRYTKNENGVSVYNTPFTTTELFHKNFDEVVALWPATYGVNAGNWGDRIEWNVAGFMDTTLTTNGTVDAGHPTFMTWSHETAHYLDSRLFLKNNGRRFDAGGEDYADAFLMQEFGINGIVMNLTVKYNKETKVASNLDPERINSEAKIKDFYSKMFDAIYVMDYLEAKAFLQLPKEYQKALAVQVSYPNEDKQFAREGGKADAPLTGSTYKEDEYARFRARETSGFTSLNSLEDLELNSLEDLIDKQIMIYPGVYKYASRGNNSYGGEGINVVHWYQPNNPDGRPDSYALKWISYEMLGYAGYDAGFVEYASNRNYVLKDVYKNLTDPSQGVQAAQYKSDQMALQKITNNAYSDFNTYKKARFKEVEDKLPHLNSAINAKYYVQALYDALIQDKAYAEENIANALKNKTEEACLADYWCRASIQSAVSFPHSTKVRQEIYYKLKDMSNDFTDDIIYMSDVQQDVSDLTVNKAN